jgi:CheY-like chemotaxis protein
MLPEREEIASVVVCEDDEPTLELLCDHLTADRYTPLAAPSASDALRHCRYKQPDLLLLDLALPDAAGLDVLRQIREADGVASATARPVLARIADKGMDGRCPSSIARARGRGAMALGPAATSGGAPLRSSGRSRFARARRPGRAGSEDP